MKLPDGELSIAEPKNRKVGKAALLAKQNLNQLRFDIQRELTALKNAIMDCDDIIQALPCTPTKRQEFTAQRDALWKQCEPFSATLKKDCDKETLQNLDEEIAEARELVDELNETLANQRVQLQFNAVECTLLKMKELFDWAHVNNYDAQALEKIKARWATTVLNIIRPLFQNNKHKSLTMNDEPLVKKAEQAGVDFIQNTLPQEPTLCAHFNTVNECTRLLIADRQIRAIPISPLFDDCIDEYEIFQRMISYCGQAKCMLVSTAGILDNTIPLPPPQRPTELERNLKLLRQLEQYEQTRVEPKPERSPAPLRLLQEHLTGQLESHKNGVLITNDMFRGK